MAVLKEEGNIIIYKTRKEEMGGKKGKKDKAVKNVTRTNLAVDEKAVDKIEYEEPNHSLEEKGSVEKGQEEEKGKDDEETRRKKYGNYIKEHVISIVVGVFVGVFVLLIWRAVHDLPEDIVELQISNAEIKVKIETLEGNYTTLNSNTWSENKEKSDKEEIGEEPQILIASTTFSSKMLNTQLSENTQSSEIEEEFITSSPFFKMEEIDNNEVIGINVKNNEEVTKDSLENSPIIIQYEEDGEEVYFYGRYNESSQWDGDCIINRYKDSKLLFVMEATYKGGQLKSYSQIFRGHNSKGQEIWYVSKRKVEGNKNSGETKTFFFYGDYKKSFDIKTVKENDILGVDRFLETIPSTMEGYYSGYTSDGKYNDGSGNAYMVKYDTKGNVRYFYQGKISDGYGNDNGKDENNKSWAFIWGDADDGYHYHEGKFKDGSPQNTKKDWQYPKDQDFINSKINPKNYNCPLTGLIN